MRRPPRIARAVVQIPDKDAYKQKPDHLACIRQIGICSVWSCNRTEIDPHHLMKIEGEHRGGVKVDDRFCVPICRHHHTTGPESIHPHGSPNYEIYIMEKWGIPGRELADALFSNTGDIEQMQRIVLKFRDYARLKMGAFA